MIDLVNPPTGTKRVNGVYALYCPADDWYFYVGQSGNVVRRLRAHATMAKSGDSAMHEQMRRFWADGKQIVGVALMATTAHYHVGLHPLEEAWIVYFRKYDQRGVFNVRPERVRDSFVRAALAGINFSVLTPSDYAARVIDTMRAYFGRTYQFEGPTSAAWGWPVL